MVPTFQTIKDVSSFSYDGNPSHPQELSPCIPPNPVKQLIQGYIQTFPAAIKNNRVNYIQMRNSQDKNSNKPKMQIKASKYFLKLNTDSSSQPHYPKRANYHSLNCRLMRPECWHLKRSICQAGVYFPISYLGSSEQK